ncbi:MAG: hypothetical protein GX066_09215 [Clostridiaceae bacterium]|nr:hypothetical protein [Clostridiaceae bacterium]
MSKTKLIKEFFEYISENKKLWLMPIFILLGLIAIAVLVSQSQAIAPFIYTLF